MSYLLAFLDTTSGEKFCFEITHNARVHVFLSVDFNTRPQRADKISSAKFATKNLKKKVYIMSCIYIVCPLPRFLHCVLHPHSYCLYFTWNARDDVCVEYTEA